MLSMMRSFTAFVLVFLTFINGVGAAIVKPLPSPRILCTEHSRTWNFERWGHHIDWRDNYEYECYTIVIHCSYAGGPDEDLSYFEVITKIECDRIEPDGTRTPIERRIVPPGTPLDRLGDPILGVTYNGTDTTPSGGLGDDSIFED